MISQFFSAMGICGKRKSLTGSRFGIALAATMLFTSSSFAAKGTKVFYDVAELGGGVSINVFDSANKTTSTIVDDLPSYTEIYNFITDTKGANLFFAGDIDTDNVELIHRVDLKSNSRTQISHTLASGGVESDYCLDPKQKALFYRAGESAGAIELFRADIKTNKVTKVSPTLPADREVVQFAVHPKGASAIYIANIDSADKFELYSSSIVPDSAPVRLNADLGEFGNVIDFKVHPKGTSVVYLADQDSDDVFELYKVDLKTLKVDKISNSLVAGGDVYEFIFDPKGSVVAYSADQEVDQQVNLYKVILKTGEIIRVNPEMPDNSDVDSDFKFDAKGGNLYYMAEQATANVKELFQSVVKTNANNRLNIPLVENGGIFNFGLDGTGKYVYYIADAEVNERLDLSRYELKTGKIIMISDPTVPNQFIAGADVHAKGTGIAYYASKTWLNSDLIYYDVKTATRTQIDGMLDFVLYYKLLGGLQFMGSIFI